ncbi:DUF4932 domain-containing protein [Spirosoma soli]|uniref:DUF4932 domain-containing protein n=1 Tax=Spirosoma soli TaxID=1770529 RepID=A0ABW5MBG1_9BACT
MKALYLNLLLLIAQLAFAQKRVTVKINKNVEIFNALAVQNTTNWLKDTLTNPNFMATSVLMRRSYHHFQSAQNHPIFTPYKRLEDKIGTGVYLLSFYYTDVPNAQRKAPVSEVILRELHPNKDSAQYLVDSFMRQLNQFYRDVQFDKFVAENQYVYQKALTEASQNLPDASFIPVLEAYYGATKHGYHIILNPFFNTDWGMGWEIASKDGMDIYNITSPLSKPTIGEDQRIVSPGFNNAPEIRRLSVHEFGHSFVNPLANQTGYKTQIERFNNLYEPIEGQQQYRDWHTQFCEYVVRAGEVRIALAMNDPAAARATEVRDAKWRYLPHFVNQLTYYEQNRKRYPTFEAFFPDLIASLAKINK